MKLFSIIHEGGGCDPESEDYTVYRERPDGDNVREWSYNDSDKVFALCRATARCCGTGHLFVSLSGDHEMLQSQANILNVIHPGPMTDYEYELRETALDNGEDYTPPRSHFVMELNVEDAYVPYVYTPTTGSPSEDAIPGWNLEDDIGLSEDVFNDAL